MEQSYQISWYAPNFINMCIDNINDGELSGRIYHCYSKEPWKFTNLTLVSNHYIITKT